MMTTVPTAEVLAVSGLRFRYAKGSEELFDDLTHVFAPGRITAGTGPSGRGKSTLLYVLGPLLTPSAGEVRVDGTDVAASHDHPRSQLRAARIGLGFQDSELDPARTIVDAVVEPGLYAGRTAREMRPRLPAAGAVRLEAGSGAPPGSDLWWAGPTGSDLSRLVEQPDIVLADEPTGNLDQGNSELVLDALAQAAHDHGHTVFIATHDPFVLDRVDEVVQL